MKTEMRHFLDKPLLISHSTECPLEDSINFNTTEDPFIINWLMDLFATKIQAAKDELGHIKTKHRDSSTKIRRQHIEAPIVAAAAIAGMGVFSSDILI